MKLCFVRRRAAVCNVLLASVLVVGAATTAADAAAAAVPTAQSPDAIDKALKFRRAFGLRADRGFVESLLAERDLATSAGFFGTPLMPSELREIRRRVRQARALPELDRYLSRRDPAHFAGIYTDQRRGGTVYVGLTRGSKVSRAEIARRLPFGQRLRVFTADFSKAALDDAHDRVGRDLDQLAARGIKLTRTFPDLRRNRVVVGLERATARAADALRAYGPAIQLENAGAVRSTSSDPAGDGVIQQPFPGETPPVRPIVFDPFPPMYAGLDVRSPGDNIGCTSGFNQVDWGTSTYYALAASICSQRDESVWHGDHVLGTVDREPSRTPWGPDSVAQYHGAARVPIDKGLRSNQVWIDQGDETGQRWRVITESTPGDFLHSGDPVCKSGMGSGYECGTVEYTDATLGCLAGCAPPTTYFVDQTVASLTSESGDANAPVFIENSALGQDTGRVVDAEKIRQAAADGVITPQELDAATEGASFAPIANVEADLGTVTYVGQRSLEDLAVDLRPILRFDSSERYRPLRITSFLAETYPTGPAHHRVCDGSPTACQEITSVDDLKLHPSPDSYLDIRGGGDEDSYRSPNPDCIGVLLFDCNAGPASAIYYHIAPDTGGAYRHIEYWWFYRLNDSPDIDDGDNRHEGDWEGVNLAVTRDDPQTFHFATFGQHGTYYNYLRVNLRCDEGGAGSCGTTEDQRGQRVMAYPANRSHATYPDPCSQRVFTDCAHRQLPFYEGGHDGAAPWGNNYDEGAFEAMPNPAPWSLPEPRNWTNWPGSWGVPADMQDNGAKGPESPGNQPPFNDPAGWECENVLGLCPGTEGGSTSAQARRRRDPCPAWLGGGVAVVGCDAAELDHAMQIGRLGQPGRFGVHVMGQERRAATAPGVSQAMGAPLSDGTKLRITGTPTPGTAVLVRARRGERDLLLRFDRISRLRAISRDLALDLSSSRPTLAPVGGSGVQIHASIVDSLTFESE